MGCPLNSICCTKAIDFSSSSAEPTHYVHPTGSGVLQRQPDPQHPTGQLGHPQRAEISTCFFPAPEPQPFSGTKTPSRIRSRILKGPRSGRDVTIPGFQVISHLMLRRFRGCSRGSQAPSLESPGANDMPTNRVFVKDSERIF